MRFAYIDSQGNEVSIPSVDALALRIELGAIGPDTELYDAQADRWGPAHTHEIFHTLSREVGGDGGFVAPPPPVAAPETPEPAAEAPSEPAPEPPAEAEPVAEPGSAPEAEAPKAVFDVRGDLGLVDEEEPAAAEEVPLVPDDEGLGFDLTLTDAPGQAPPDDVLADDQSLDLAPAQASDGGTDDDEGDAFDFGGFGALELEAPPVEDEAEPVSPMPMESADDGAMDFSGGEEFGGGLELEQPMSEFTGGDGPSWMEQDGPAGDESMDFEAGSGQSDAYEAPVPPPYDEASDEKADAPLERRERPEPRSRPSPPRRRKTFPTGPVLGVVAVLVLGGGGYFVWNTFLSGGAGSEGGSQPTAPVALPAVTIPDIPAEFLPVMRDLGEAALVAMIDDLRGMQAEFNLAVEPRNDWLAGVYLANASQFRDVQAYWEGIESYVDRVRDLDTRTFHDKYVAQLEAAEITGDTAAILLARADSGFLATRNARFEAYALMDDLVNAALDLHRFLLLNEENIEYDPAAGGVSRDPVLEAVPATRELGNEMWDMVDRITGALDALGTLDRVTTERLTAVLFDRIRRAGFQ